jgi:hypothetical protein
VIRIFTADEPNAITITVDGRLMDDYVEAVESSSREAIERGRPVHVYLRDVSHIDERGRELLSRLASEGVRLSASGIYSSYIVDEISRKQVDGSHKPSHVAAPKRAHSCK